MDEREKQRLDRVRNSLTRRQAIAGGATLLTAGGTLVWVGEPSSARVQIDGFSVADQTFDRESVEPVVDATIQFDYDVGNSAVQKLVVTLAIDGTAVAEDVLNTSATTATSETTLSGRVTESDAWSASDFQPDVADKVEREISVTVEFAVIADDGSKIVSDTATDTGLVVVSHPQESEYVATVGGTATIEASDQ